eukprot:CAMPEP_0113553088 /NCGR_PEP_ID=MMETSP0015_2-20120614/15421_1 /TAXON_ID=2838 /ORGANISM="Odontella" /LENGTH=1029 /DNA_ID=CAMNT_0000454123 /DNA_START=285 /DNA_END=3370 /DNA_ORIENTATION=- /assembly_acc=CAM_ASM_000160
MSHYGNFNPYVHKPDQALRRSLELRSIAQPAAALSLLHEVLSSRRHRTWSPTYEKIMIAYLDLCMELNRSREAKDGLHQYRNLSQSQAPGSLEVVIRHLIDKAERACSEAKAAADAKVAAGSASPASAAEDSAALEVDDLDTGAGTGSSLLLTTVSADPLRTQTDHGILLPRLRFLWESYRAVLDILRSNSKLERLYHGTARGALEFCGKYRRKTEFRRLCDMLRMHLGNLQKYGGGEKEMATDGKPNSKVRGWEGWTTESIEMHLQTRFVQLESASSLFLYTEGFRTVEDIYNILQISHSRAKRLAAAAAQQGQNAAAAVPAAMPKAKLMAAYYEKLTDLFWVSENRLFHAFAWHKFYTLCKEYNRGMTSEQRSLQASAVLLSALCIPPTAADSGGKKNDHLAAVGKSAEDDRNSRNAISSTVRDEIAREKRARMAMLLGFHTRNPTREALLSEILRARGSVMEDVPSYLRDLYRLLEENTDPLVLVEQARPLLDRLRTEAGDGTSEEKKDDADVAEASGGPLGKYFEPLVSVLLQKLVRSLAKSFRTVSLDRVKSLTEGLGVPFVRVERAIVGCARDDDLSRSSATIRVRIDHRANCLRFGEYSAGEEGDDGQDGSGSGSRVGALESDAMRKQLLLLSTGLAKVSSIVDPADDTQYKAEKAQLFMVVRSKLSSEHEAMLARKELIERRKEEAERLAQEKIKEAARIKAEQDAAARAEEARRLEREQRVREREKLQKIQKELDIQEKKRLLKAMGKEKESEVMTEEQLELVDTQKLAREHAAKANKKKEEAERKVKELSKRLDYIVRATRIEELPLVRKRYEEKVKRERERYEAEVVEKARRARAKWEADCSDKAALSEFGVFEVMEEFSAAAMVGRELAHKVACTEEDKRAELEAEHGKLNRARKRKDEEERRRAEEEEKARIEEEERREEEEKKQKEEERKKREVEEAEARKKEMERMAEAQKRKERERAEAAPKGPSSRDLDAAASRGGDRGGGGGLGGGGGGYVPPSRRGGGGGGAGGSRWGNA